MSIPHDDWRAELREARRRLKVNQRELARRAGLSFEAVRGYESGRRSPRREHLSALLDALQIDRAWRNRILLAAGFAPDGLEVRPSNVNDWWLTPREAETEQASYPWPAFVVSERGEVLSANAALQAIWGIDMTRELLDPVERSLFRIVSWPRVADRCLNWDEAMAIIARMFKTFHRRQEDLEDPSPYFSAVLSEFLKGDPKYVGRLTEIWESAPETYAFKARWTYPIVWQQPGIGVMRFKCLISSVSEIDGLALQDWIPLDGESWRVLELAKQQARWTDR